MHVRRGSQNSISLIDARRSYNVWTYGSYRHFSLYAKERQYPYLFKRYESRNSNDSLTVPVALMKTQLVEGH